MTPDPVDTGLHLPIEDYLLTGKQAKDLADARMVLALSCLDRFDIERPLIPKPRTSFRPGDTSIVVNPARRYGVLDPEVVSRYGYHPEPGTYPDLTTSAEPELTRTAALVLHGDEEHPDRRVRVHGRTVPDGGCLGEAQRRLGGRPGVYGDSSLAAELNVNSFAVTRDDPRVRAAIDAWSACMRVAGHPQTDPLEALGQGKPSVRPTATRQEIAVATADLACKRSTRLAAVWAQAEREYQEAAIRAKSDEFAQITVDLATQVSRAEAALDR